MMRKLVIILIGTAALTATSPAIAGWKLIRGNVEANLKKSGMAVTPKQEWNRWSRRPSKKSEVWTLDGMALNEVIFFGGVVTGDTLYKDRNKKTKPLPKFDSNMLIPDIVQWFEATNRILLDTALFEIDTIEPQEFLGQQGFRFEYHYVVKDDELTRKGEVVGAMINGKLYMASYVAPEIHFFDHNRADFTNLVSTLRLTGKK